MAAVQTSHRFPTSTHRSPFFAPNLTALEDSLRGLRRKCICERKHLGQRWLLIRPHLLGPLEQNDKDCLPWAPLVRAEKEKTPQVFSF
jgi:hypothetical protein